LTAARTIERTNSTRSGGIPTASFSNTGILFTGGGGAASVRATARGSAGRSNPPRPFVWARPRRGCRQRQGVSVAPPPVLLAAGSRDGRGRCARRRGPGKTGGAGAGGACRPPLDVARAPPVALPSSLLVASGRGPRAGDPGAPPCRRPLETGGPDPGRAPEPDPRRAVARPPLGASGRESANEISSVA